ncbi:MAG: SET domain-containing histone-lysine N-methyltransferase [Cystobacter sp.]
MSWGSIPALMSTDTAESSSNQKLSNLLRWLEQGGGHFPKVRLIRHEDGERSAIAQAAIAPGEVVMKIPSTHLFTVEQARESEIGQALREKLDPDNLDLYLASFLLQEREREDSFWKPYIDSLPESYPHLPLFFDEAEHAQLKGSLVLSLVTFQAQSLQKDYQRLCERIPGYDRFSPRDFVWARLSVSSRQFNVKKGGLLGETLVPLADMLQHRRQSDVLWETSEDGKFFVVTANVAVAAGDEIHVNYGNKSNDVMLLHFGFLLEDNEHDEAFVGLEILQGDPLIREKQALLSFAPDTTARPFKLSRQYVHPYTRMAFSFLRVAAALPSDFEEFSQQQKAGERVHGPLNLDNEERALELLGLTCEARLSLYPTTLEEDDRLLREGTLSKNTRNCVLVRREEKRLLRDYIAMTHAGRQLINTPREEVEQLAARSDTPWGWFDAYVRTDLLKLIREKE